MTKTPRSAEALPPGSVLTPMQPKAVPHTRGGGADDRQQSNARGRSNKQNQTNKCARGRSNGAGHPNDRFGPVNTFVDITMRDLSNRAMRAWAILWRDTKPNGLATAGADDIARRAGYSVRTAKRALKELRERRLIEVVRRGGIGRGTSVYRVTGIPGDAASK